MPCPYSKQVSFNDDGSCVCVANLLSQQQPTFKERFEPELLALLNLVLFKFSVYDSNATYGAQLQNLKYRNEWKHRGPCK